MVLCSGHLSYLESVALFEEAKKRNITKMIATHPMTDVIWPAYTIEEIKKLADIGCYIEHCYRNCLPLLGSYRPESYIPAIRAIGAERTILCTDFAQITDTSPAEGMRQFIATMLQMQVTEEEITLMVKTNPAKLLDLDK
jgi:adenine deaminase